MSAGAAAGGDAAWRAMAWRASRRGTLEVSMILSGYLDGRAGEMGEEERAAMANLLDFADADLWDLLVTEAREPEEGQEGLVARLRAYAKETDMNGAGRNGAV